MNGPSKVCGGDNGRPFLGLSQDGRLWQKQGQNLWEELEFNEIYRGYYPHSTFTALECFDNGFIAAGLSEEDGLPIVFQSILGGVWDQINLMGRSPVADYIRASGRINSILYEEMTKQIFLLCANGDLVTLPDCPKCVRIKRIADTGIVSGYSDGEYLHLILENGEKIWVPLQEAVQYRISFSYARQRLLDGGYLVDLRMDPRRNMEGIIEGSISVLMDEFYDWLSDKPKDYFIALFCSYGINADEAVRYARSKGYVNAFSMGGFQRMFHVE